MSKDSEAPKAAPPWFEHDRVTVTPTHYEIQISQPIEKSADPIEAVRDQEAGGLPDLVKVRRTMRGRDILCLDRLPPEDRGDHSQNFALAEQLTGVRRSVFERMHWDDFFFVYRAVQSVSEGKG